MKIVIDTNVLISGILWQGPPNEILELVENDKLQLIQSVETYDELEKVIQKGKFAEILKNRKLDLDMILEAIFTIAKFYQITINTANKVRQEVAIEDADDLKFIELAVEAGAAFIISGDRHLLKIKKHENTAIVNPVEFLEKIQK